MTTTFLEQAHELGRKAAHARYQRDDALARFFRESLRQIKAATPDYQEKQTLEEAYCEAYREEYSSLSPASRPN